MQHFIGERFIWVIPSELVRWTSALSGCYLQGRGSDHSSWQGERHAIRVGATLQGRGREGSGTTLSLCPNCTHSPQYSPQSHARLLLPMPLLLSQLTAPRYCCCYRCCFCLSSQHSDIVPVPVPVLSQLAAHTIPCLSLRRPLLRSEPCPLPRFCHVLLLYYLPFCHRPNSSSNVGVKSASIGNAPGTQTTELVCHLTSFLA